MVKRCRICKEIKGLDCFHNLTKSPDGKMDKCKECRQEYYLGKRKERLEYQRIWDHDNREKKYEYIRKKRKIDPQYKIRSKLRSRLKGALNGKAKCAHTKDLVGCEWSYLEKYLELQFRPGMTWDNIHIDHMMPCKAFDLTLAEAQKACFHYTNLQPLFQPENNSKGAKIIYDMVWRNNRWHIRDNPFDKYHSRANILSVVFMVKKLVKLLPRIKLN